MEKQTIANREITQEMQESYLDYAMSVIVARALPDVRDGLKPVHRRILYAMHELGLTHSAKYMKSARVVGECFTKDTYITTTKGLIPIQDIRIGDLVYTHQNIKPVTLLFRMPPRPLYSITLSNGVVITATPSQPIKTLDKDWNFVWKEAKTLEKGSWLPIRAVYPQKLPEVILSSFQEKQKKLNSDIAYILGFLVSDGWVAKDYSKKKHPRIGFGTADKAIAQKLVHCFKEEFGYSPTIETKIFTNPFYTVRINRKEINEYILNEFKISADTTATTKSIPSLIFMSPCDTIFSFIAGLLDGDGSIAKNRTLIHYCSVSSKLIDQLQILLQQVGIFSKRYLQKNTGKPSVINGRPIRGKFPLHTLEIESRDAQNLAKRIMPYLTSPKKKSRVHTIITANPARLWSNFDLIPYGSNILFSELSQAHRGGGWFESTSGGKFRMGIHYQNGSKMRYSSDLKEKPLRLQQIIEFEIAKKLELIGSSRHTFIKSVIQHNIHFLQVKSIEQVPAEETYDMQVADDHEFLANGILSHNCLGKYHPHGDTAVYDSLVRMAQDFSLRYPLVQGQGNFGSIDADPAAAQRYTECRMASLAELMLADIEKGTVDFSPNYDNSRTEPDVLPARAPQLLLNGSLGIAVGMATNIPPHNMGELADAIIHLIGHPKASVEDLAQIVKGPDFPTAGIIFNKKDILHAYATGKGGIVTRAETEVVETKQGTFQIIASSIPFQVNKSTLLEKIAELVRDKRVDGIKDLRDESDKDGLRIAIDLKPGAFPQKVLNSLYKHTDLERVFHVNMIALVDGIQPQVLSLKNILEEFIKHRRVVIERRTAHDLTKAQERAHILEGLTKALDHIDAVIKVIKSSADKETAHNNLMAQFKLTTIQSSAILEMRLQTLAGLERKKIEDELAEKKKLIANLGAILADPKKVLGIVKQDTEELKKLYPEGRRTRVVSGAAKSIAVEDMVPEEETTIILTKGGYMKRVNPEEYRSQHRGGKGSIGIMTKEEDVVDQFITVNTHDNLLFFTSLGKVYQIHAYDIPEGKRTSKGKSAVNFLMLATNETVTSLLPMPKKESIANISLAMITKNGIVKKTEIRFFVDVRRSGIIAIKLQKGDHLGWVHTVDSGDHVILATKMGLAVRFPQSEVRNMGRTSAGVRGIRLKKNDEVVGADCIAKGSSSLELLVLSQNGFGKKTTLKDYKAQKRGGSGIKTMNVTVKTGPLVAAHVISPKEEDLIAVSQKGQVIRMQLSAIPTLGRATQGVRIMRIDPRDKVASVTAF